MGGVGRPADAFDVTRQDGTVVQLLLPLPPMRGGMGDTWEEGEEADRTLAVDAKQVQQERSGRLTDLIFKIQEHIEQIEGSKLRPRFQSASDLLEELRGLLRELSELEPGHPLLKEWERLYSLVYRSRKQEEPTLREGIRLFRNDGLTFALS